MAAAAQTDGHADGEDAAAAESPVRSRTRAAIVQTAITVWSRDFSASLTEIAEAAEVARSTLHRYFPDRPSLLAQAHSAAVERIEDAYSVAASGQTRAIDELTASIRASVAAGDAVVFLYADPARFAELPHWGSDEEEGQAEVLALISRAQADGDLAPDLDPPWILTVLYSLLYAGAEAVAQGQLAPHAAGDLVTRTFLRGVS